MDSVNMHTRLLRLGFVCYGFPDIGYEYSGIFGNHFVWIVRMNNKEPEIRITLNHGKQGVGRSNLKSWLEGVNFSGQ